MLMVLWLVLCIVAATTLAYLNASGVAWLLVFAALAAITWVVPLVPVPVAIAITALVATLAVILGVPAVRRMLITRPLLDMFRRILPPMSQTEREAIDAGTVWWDGELFSGKPDWNKLLDVERRRCVPMSSVSSTTAERAVRHGERLGDDQRLQGPAAARVAVHQGQGLPRDDHSEGVRRPRLFGARAFGSGDQAVDALRHGRGHRDGAQFARTRRTAAALRHRGAEDATTCRASRRDSRFRASR